MAPFPAPQRRQMHWLFAAILCGILAVAAWRVQLAVEEAAFRAARLVQRETVLLELNSVRYRLEAEVTSSLYLVAGLGSYISAHPEITREEFHAMAAALLVAKPSLINVAAAPDMVIRYIYPEAGNEQAIGLDYRLHREQREAAMRVRETGQPVVAGPVDLVQGGKAIITRFPVFSTRQDGQRFFWGIMSTPLEFKSVLESAGIIAAGKAIELAIRGKDGAGSAGEVFYGRPDLFDGDCVRVPLNLFSGSWELAGMPAGAGWIQAAPNRTTIRAIVWTVYGLIVVNAFLLAGYVVWLEKNREQEASVSQAKSRFLANMSHEVRTPLNGIYGIAQLLRCSGLKEEQAQWTDVILQSARSLNDLLSDILNLSKLENGHYEPRAEVVELEPFVESVVSVARVQAEQKGLVFRVAPLPRECRVLIVDSLVLRQVLWNLLSNAVKFTESGAVVLDFSLERRKPVNGSDWWLRMQVEDTGVGIAPNRIESVFGDFVQEDSSTTRRFGGTGLGLAIVRRLVDQLEGDIAVESAKGRGSRFVVRLPVRTKL